MSPEIFNFILWLPFGLVFFGIGITFSLKGFRKGIFHALISTGATVVAIGVSFFAAKLVAPLAVDAVVSLLPDYSNESNAAIAGIMPMLVEGLVTGLLALIVFSVLFSILVPVCKILLALVPTPTTHKLLFRILGAALRFVDAVIVAVFVLLPIYGSLAAYAPAVETLLDMTEQTTHQADAPEELAVQDYIHRAAEHPVVSLTKCPPFSMVYNGLSSVNTSAGTINVPEMVQTMTKTVDAFQSIAEGNFTPEDWDNFIAMQKDAAGTDWFYAVCSSTAEALEDRVQDAEEGTPANLYLQTLQDLMALPQESFTQSYTGLLDWMSFAAEKGLFQKIEDGTLDEEWLNQSGIIEKASELQETLPNEFSLTELVDRFFADSAA